MTSPVRFIQSQAPTSPGPQDFVSLGAGDCQGIELVLSRCSTNGTAVEHALQGVLRADLNDNAHWVGYSGGSTPQPAQMRRHQNMSELGAQIDIYDHTGTIVAAVNISSSAPGSGPITDGWRIEWVIAPPQGWVILCMLYTDQTQVFLRRDQITTSSRRVNTPFRPQIIRASMVSDAVYNAPSLNHIIWADGVATDNPTEGLQQGAVFHASTNGATTADPRVCIETGVIGGMYWSNHTRFRFDVRIVDLDDTGFNYRGFNDDGVTGNQRISFMAVAFNNPAVEANMQLYDLPENPGETVTLHNRLETQAFLTLATLVPEDGRANGQLNSLGGVLGVGGEDRGGVRASAATAIQSGSSPIVAESLTAGRFLLMNDDSGKVFYDIPNVTFDTQGLTFQANAANGPSKALGVHIGPEAGPPPQPGGVPPNFVIAVA